MIRIGGDTADSSVFCEECASTLNATFVAGSTEAVSVVYSKAFFQVLEENLGPDQQYIVGLNFASGKSFMLCSTCPGSPSLRIIVTT